MMPFNSTRFSCLAIPLPHFKYRVDLLCNLPVALRSSLIEEETRDGYADESWQIFSEIAQITMQ